MTDLINGFTGFSGKREEGFESAAEASRKLQAAIAAGKGMPAPASSSAVSSGVMTGAFGAAIAPDSARAARDAELRREREQEQELAPAPEGVPFDFEELDAMACSDQRWAWLEIDLAAIRHNVAETRRYLSARTRLMAVVKADAYGHGAVQASKAMLGAGADRLAVATVPEAIELRKAGITAPIAILEQPPITSVPLLLAYHITPAIYEPDFAVAYGEVADLHGVTAPYHLAVNTGMNRVGVSYREAAEFLQQVSFHRALELEGVFTHFATADSPETLDFQMQTKRFVEGLESIYAAGFNPGIIHAANSAATYRFPDVHFDMVRCGIALYGIHPCEATRNHVDLRPAMSVHARIIDTRNVQVSEGVSYGYRYRSPGSVKICTLPLGYADGLRRGLSGNIDIIMAGRYYRQVGAICMDQCMFEVDLRDRRSLSFDPQVGDHVTIVGTEGAAQVTMEDLAERLHDTIPYEMTCGFGQRMERVYR